METVTIPREQLKQWLETCSCYQFTDGGFTNNEDMISVVQEIQHILTEQT